MAPVPGNLKQYDDRIELGHVGSGNKEVLVKAVGPQTTVVVTPAPECIIRLMDSQPRRKELP